MLEILCCVLLIISITMFSLKAKECYYCGSRNIFYLFEDKAICRDCNRKFNGYAWLDKNNDL